MSVLPKNRLHYLKVALLATCAASVFPLMASPANAITVWVKLGGEYQKAESRGFTEDELRARLLLAKELRDLDSPERAQALKSWQSLNRAVAQKEWYQSGQTALSQAQATTASKRTSYEIPTAILRINGAWTPRLPLTDFTPEELAAALTEARAQPWSTFRDRSIAEVEEALMNGDLKHGTTGALTIPIDFSSTTTAMDAESVTTEEGALDEASAVDSPSQRIDAAYQSDAEPMAQPAKRVRTHEVPATDVQSTPVSLPYTEVAAPRAVPPSQPSTKVSNRSQIGRGVQNSADDQTLSFRHRFESLGAQPTGNYDQDVKAMKCAIADFRKVTTQRKGTRDFYPPYIRNAVISLFKHYREYIQTNSKSIAFAEGLNIPRRTLSRWKKKTRFSARRSLMAPSSASRRESNTSPSATSVPAVVRPASASATSSAPEAQLRSSSMLRSSSDNENYEAEPDEDYVASDDDNVVDDEEV